MFEVKKSSWHYKLQVEFFTKPGKTLCSYFWKTVGGVGLLLLFCLFILVVLISMIVTAGGFIFFEEMPYGMIFAGGIFWALAFATLINYLIEDYDIYEKITKQKPYKQPSILTKYIKAKKQKVCPMIKVVDDKNEP